MSDPHGARDLACLRLDSYNLELQEDGGFVGDRVRSKAFAAVLDTLRDQRRQTGADPLGEVSSRDRPALDALLNENGSIAAELVKQAIEIYACAFADVVRRFLADEAWHGTERIAVGGGLRENRIGEEAIRRAEAWLNSSGQTVELRPIRSDPDEAALLGAVHLCPSELLNGCEGMLAVDIGGSNLRAGVVLLNRHQATDFSASKVLLREHWRHGAEPVGRDATVDRLNGMLKKLVQQAEEAGVRLAPFVGLGCPGEIRSDGAITGGAQNLPGNWEAADFNLPERVRAALPVIDSRETVVVLHNDAVVQGLSELPFMRDVSRWGILTIGTGLGNARFTNTSHGKRVPDGHDA